MVKSWVWIVVVAVLAVASVTLSVVLWVVPRQTATVAYVYVDGVKVYTVDLSAVEAPYEYEVVTPYGSNTLAIERGRIRILSADCEGEDCVHQGWISRGGQPLVCLPHRLVVQIEGVGEDNKVVQ